MGHHKRSPSRWKPITIYCKDGPKSFELEGLGTLVQKGKQRRRKGQPLMSIVGRKPKQNFPLLEPVHPILPPRELAAVLEKG
jgi:hypothetical protein